MNSRGRVLATLDHEEPDRIPVDFWASAGMRAAVEAAHGLTFNEFLDEHDVDLRYIAGPRYIGPPLKSNGADVDIWGVPRQVVTVETRSGTERYSEVVRPPLADAVTVADVESYPHWPSPDWFDYGVIESQCDRLRAKERAVVFMGDRLNRAAQLKPAMYLRGVDTILMDMAVRPDLARALFGRIRGFYADYLPRILKAANGKIDIVLTGDDFGMQEGLFVSPAMWDDFLRPGFEDYIGLIKAHGAAAMHHTCGSVVKLIPRFIECGLDVLQSLQPEARGMDPVSLKERYGDRLCLHGGISIQRTMPHGTPDDVRREVERLAAGMGRRGGYIFCTAHNIQADTPMENVTALLDAYGEFSRTGRG